MPTTLLSQGVKKKAPDIGPECAAAGRTLDPPEPQGEVLEGLNTLEGVGMEVVRKAVLRMMLMDQVQLDPGPSKPSWQQGGLPQSPQPVQWLWVGASPRL